MGLFGKPDPRPAPERVVAPPPPSPPSPAANGTVMGEKTRWTGKVDTDEPLLIRGQLKGEIKSSSEVVIGETGEVRATLTARSIVICGRMFGDCTASDRLEIRASGKLNGSIKAGRIAIADGAEFKGTSQMATNAKS